MELFSTPSHSLSGFQTSPKKCFSKIHPAGGCSLCVGLSDFRLCLRNWRCGVGRIMMVKERAYPSQIFDLCAVVHCPKLCLIFFFSGFLGNAISHQENAFQREEYL